MYFSSHILFSLFYLLFSYFSDCFVNTPVTNIFLQYFIDLSTRHVVFG